MLQSLSQKDKSSYSGPIDFVFSNLDQIYINHIVTYLGITASKKYSLLFPDKSHLFGLYTVTRLTEDNAKLLNEYFPGLQLKTVNCSCWMDELNWFFQPQLKPELENMIRSIESINFYYHKNVEKIVNIPIVCERFQSLKTIEFRSFALNHSMSQYFRKLPNLKNLKMAAFHVDNSYKKSSMVPVFQRLEKIDMYYILPRNHHLLQEILDSGCSLKSFYFEIETRQQRNDIMMKLNSQKIKLITLSFQSYGEFNPKGQFRNELNLIFMNIMTFDRHDEFYLTEIIKRCTKLRRLECNTINNAQEDNLGLDSSDDLAEGMSQWGKYLPHLTHLQICNVFSNVDTREICKTFALHSKRLTWIMIHDCFPNGDKIVLELAKCRNLRYIDIYFENTITNKSIQKLISNNRYLLGINFYKANSFGFRHAKNLVQKCRYLRRFVTNFKNIQESKLFSAYLSSKCILAHD